MNDIVNYLQCFVWLELNDSVRRKNFEQAFPDIQCDETINTPEAIDRNCLRFVYQDKLYEYQGSNVLFELM